MVFSESKIVANILPGENNPRNSEGSFIRLDDGRIAFAFSRYTGDSDHDNARCNIAVIYSWDDGETWDTEHIEILINAEEYNEENVMSVTLERMNNGDIGMFYMLKHQRKGSSCSYMLRRYRGDFSNFISEVKCFPHAYESYFVVVNDRVLHLSDGTWMIAGAYHVTDVCWGTPAEGRGGYAYYDGIGVVHTFYSTDDGVTWHQNPGRIYLDDAYSRTGVEEPGLIELPGGVLYCYMRTDKMYQYESVSLDRGVHWFKPQPSRFTAPASPMLVKKNPYSGKYYAIWNPIPITMDHPFNRITGGRNPFVMAESEDGVNFGEPVILENDPNRGFAYPAAYFMDAKTMLVAYCNGGAEQGTVLNSTGIRKITLQE